MKKKPTLIVIQTLLFWPAGYKKEGKTVLKYFIAGSGAALVQLATYYLLIQLLGVEMYIFSTSVAFVIAMSISFILQKYWTFRDNSLRRIPRQLIIFFTIALMNLILNGFLMYMAVNILNRYMVAQIVVMGIIAVASFILNRTMTFTNNNNE